MIARLCAALGAVLLLMIVLFDKSITQVPTSKRDGNTVNNVAIVANGGNSIPVHIVVSQTYLVEKSIRNATRREGLVWALMPARPRILLA